MEGGPILACPGEFLHEAYVLSKNPRPLSAPRTPDLPTVLAPSPPPTSLMCCDLVKVLPQLIAFLFMPTRPTHPSRPSSNLTSTDPRQNVSLSPLFPGVVICLHVYISVPDLRGGSILLSCVLSGAWSLHTLMLSSALEWNGIKSLELTKGE